MEWAFNPDLTKDDVNECPLYRYEGEVVLVESEALLEKALPALAAERVLGFDTETKPTFRKGKIHDPALIQLAASDKVYLFLLKKVPLDGRLAAILENPLIIKAGVAIADDMSSLQKLYAFHPAGVVDLGSVARKNNIGMFGLRGLAACFLGVRISKTARCSNWGSPQLRARQITYAATDAWISRKIYTRAEELGLLHG
jgi:ribonuclease D